MMMYSHKRFAKTIDRHHGIFNFLGCLMQPTREENLHTQLLFNSCLTKTCSISLTPQLDFYVHARGSCEGLFLCWPS